MHRFTSVMQLVNSYFVAKTIHEMRGDKEIVSDSDFVFYEKWGIKTKDKRIQETFKRIVEATRRNVKIAALAKVALEAIDEFEFVKSPSVSSNQNDNKNLRASNSLSDLDVLRKVDLRAHTLNVVEAILKETEAKEIYGVGQIIIACILHDFGKSRKVRELVAPDSVSENSSKYRPHAEVSGLYVRDVLSEKVRLLLLENDENSEISETIKQIAELVANHHNSSKQWKHKVELINKADALARKKELSENQNK